MIFSSFNRSDYEFYLEIEIECLIAIGGAKYENILEREILTSNK